MNAADHSESFLPVASIIIPAHNEDTVIGRCLDRIRSDSQASFEVVVVVNGSSDRTGDVAVDHLRHHPAAVVEVIPTASKIAALRRGDEIAQTYPRVYLDADIQVSARALTDLARVLADHAEPAVGAPRMVVDTRGCGWALRAYHNVWTRLPYAEDGVIGAGIYAVNEAGGAVKGTFPDVMNDDAYVRGVFGPDQRLTTPGVFIVAAPRTVAALVRRRARVHIGNEAVEEMVTGSGRSTTRSALLRIVRRREATVGEVAAYVWITAAAFAVARVRRLRGTHAQWSTDVTSRVLQEHE
ncbi:glycosyltransferase [uncultured Williamsia sp.]|uniref:glycosyltransferase n=1 Tax=uncultured Williamsia sp. TaxID=259311 RepID=UPI0026113421|nr:glycosyltransferase [uncultured Williamsia sp.]